MKLTSTSFGDGAEIPLEYAERSCGGQNRRPQLSWSGAPEGTKSYAITIYDPDAPTGSGWWHWVVFDIPADVTELDSDAPLPAAAREWVNDYNYLGYGGACPPPGPAHHYIHTVYALPEELLPVSDYASSASVRFALLAAARDKGSFTGLFALPPA